MSISIILIFLLTRKISEYIPVENSAFNLSDRNWEKGVAKHWAGFFVSKSSKNVQEYTVGNKVRFINEDIRTIKRMATSRRYLNLYLDGAPLDGNTVGYPKKIQVIK